MSFKLVQFPLPLQTPEEEEVLNKKRSKKTQKKYDDRKKTAKISTLLEEQFQQGKLLGKSSVWCPVIGFISRVIQLHLKLKVADNSESCGHKINVDIFNPTNKTLEVAVRLTRHLVY